METLREPLPLPEPEPQAAAKEAEQRDLPAILAAGPGDLSAGAEATPGEGPAVRLATAALLPRVKNFAKALSAYFTAQVLTQLLGLTAGLVLVRTLPVREFALYTLALSVVTFFTLASDLGSTTSLLHFFHLSVRRQEEFPPYVAAVRSLRRRAFLIGAACVAVALPRAARAKGFGTLEVALTTLGVLASVWCQLGASVSVLVLRLADRYGMSYRAEIAGSGLRLAAAGAMAATSRLYGWLAILGNAAATATTALLARPRGRRTPATPANAATPANGATVDLSPYRRRILRYLLPTLPSAVYFSLQGPLVVWLAATFGATRNIAQVGALSRLGLLLGLFSNLSGIVLLPRLARIADDRLYRNRCLQFGALLGGVAVSLLLAVFTFPRAFLALLGQRYAGLDSELLLVAAGSGLTLLDGYLVSVNLARSWTRWQGAAVAVLALAQALLVALLPLATTRGVLTFNVLSALVALGTQAVITFLGFWRPRLVQWE